MKGMHYKLATISFAALLLASCSDSSNDSSNTNNNVPSNTTVVGSSVTSITDAQELAARVTNYKVGSTDTKALTRSGIATRAYINRSSSAIDITTVSQLRRGVEYYVPAGVTETRSFDISDATIYVEGNFTYNCTGTGGSVNVCNGGTLTAAESSEPFGSSDISCDEQGTIIMPKNQKEINIKGIFYYWKSDVLDFGNAVVNFNYYKTIANGVQSLMAYGNLKAKEVHVSNGSQIMVQGSIVTDKLTVSDDNSMAIAFCSIVCSGDIDVADNTGVYCSYIKAKNLKQAKNATVDLAGNYMLDISNEYYSDGNINLGYDNCFAVVKCGKITLNTSDEGTVESKILSTSGKDAHIILDCANGVYNSNGKKVDADFVSGNIILSTDDEAKNYSIAATECNPSGWPAKKEDPDPDTPKGRLDLISNIEYDDTHKHDISATGIMPLDGNMYMSYHTRDSQHGGCVEVFTPVTNDKVTLRQYLYDSAEDLDFNHLLAVKKTNDEKMVYLPGSSYKKGGILAYLPVQSDGLLAADSQTITEGEGKNVTYKEPLQFIQMNPATAEYAKGGYDENCVVYNEKTNQLIVMTTKGYIIYDADTYNEVQRVEKTGKAKHVAIGDGKIVTLVLDKAAENENQEIPATVEVFDQSTTDFSKPSTSFSVSTIQPNNGKNVIAINNGKIYVCRGAAGMYVYDVNGTNIGHYQMPNAQITNQNSEKYNSYKAYANGLFVDDNYVYIAYGSYGLVVLDKNTLKVVAHKVVKKSANYVTVSNGYIYVAYGKSRLQVFKLYTGEMQ